MGSYACAQFVPRTLSGTINIVREIACFPHALAYNAGYSGCWSCLISVHVVLRRYLREGAERACYYALARRCGVGGDARQCRWCYTGRCSLGSFFKTDPRLASPASRPVGVVYGRAHASFVGTNALPPHPDPAPLLNTSCCRCSTITPFTNRST
jgi:hypothetical protein